MVQLVSLGVLYEIEVKELIIAFTAGVLQGSIMGPLQVKISFVVIDPILHLALGTADVSSTSRSMETKMKQS